MKNSRKRLFIILLSVVAFILLSSNNIIELITNYLWFKSISYDAVFLVQLFAKILLFIPLGLFFGLFLTFYFRKLYKHFSTHPKLEVIIINGHRFKKYINLMGILLGAFIAIIVTNILWFDILKFINAVSFAKSDPLFNLDISFYVFTLPLIREICVILLFFFILVILGTLLLEIMFDDKIEKELDVVTLEHTIKNINRLFFTNVFKKISTLVMACFVLLGVLFYLNTYELLYSTRGVAFGASFTDITITLWAYRLYSVIALASAGLTWFAVKKNKIRFFLTGPLLLIATMVAFTLTGEIVQRLIVEPDEISKESKYLVYSINNTQEAFNLANVETVDFPYEENLTMKMIEDNMDTIKNIRINDARPLIQTFNQIQSIRLYYEFYDIDIDRYTLNGEYTQVFISPRELNQYKLDNKAMTWLNQFLKYTHGYGIVMSPVNKVTEEGQPVLLFKNIPPLSATNLAVTRPEIYFGEGSEKYIIVNSEEKEFDYPSGSENVETMYSGDTGITLEGINKLLFSLREKSLKLLVSNNVNADSKIIINRNILDRVTEIAPFLKYDSNPYIVLNEEDGKLYWIIDAFTDTEFYPYSQIFEFEGLDVNYIRNSVKVVIDAYDGTTNFYIYDETDPIIKTFSKIYPTLFKEKSDFPTGLAAHVKYPQDYFDLQAEVYRKYHVDNPVVFYNGEDVWDLATEKYMSDVQTVESNYVMFKIDDQVEFSLILPFTPKGKPNMTSLLVARNDAPHYGEVFMYRFPKDKTVQGPIMVESRIDQDSVISPQFTLWGQQGSRVLRGNVIVVPIENSLLYVEPIYIQSDNEDSLPEMKRVIISYNDEIVMEQTLMEGINRLFGKETPIETLEKSLQELIDQINSKFELTQDALDELQKLILELEEKAK